MANGRRKHDWDIGASVMALLANCHRNREERARPFHPQEFHPFKVQTAPKRRTVDRLDKKEGFGLLKRLFVDQKG